jgi:hypothetical protein
MCMPRGHRCRNSTICKLANCAFSGHVVYIRGERRKRDAPGRAIPYVGQTRLVRHRRAGGLEGWRAGQPRYDELNAKKEACSKVCLRRLADGLFGVACRARVLTTGALTSRAHSFSTPHKLECVAPDHELQHHCVEC